MLLHKRERERENKIFLPLKRGRERKRERKRENEYTYLYTKQRGDGFFRNEVVFLLIEAVPFHRKAKRGR